MSRSPTNVARRSARVGNGGEFSSPAGGTIFLRVNDCDDGVADYSGELSVEFIP